MFKNLVTLIERVDDEAAERLEDNADAIGAAGGIEQPEPSATRTPLGLSLAQGASTSSLHATSLTTPPMALVMSSSDAVDTGRVGPHCHREPQEQLPASDAAVATEVSVGATSHSTDVAGQAGPCRRVAELECELRLSHVKVNVLQQDILRLHRDLDLRNDLLHRLASATRRSTDDSVDRVQHAAELCCEVDAVVGAAVGGEASPLPADGGAVSDTSAAHAAAFVRQLEHTVRYHQEAQNNLRESNIALREQLLKDEAATAAEREQWAQQWGPLSAQAERATQLAKEVDRRKEEALHAWTRMSSLQTALREATEKRDLAAKETDALRKVILLRDEELLSLRMSGGGAGVRIGSASGDATPCLPTVATSRVMLAAEKKWFGPPLKKSIHSLDYVCLQVGRALYRYAWLRLFVFVYVVVLHVHMFHVVTVVVHGMPHNGDDVHEYLKHHMK